MDTIDNPQNLFHKRLTSYINCCALTKMELVASMISLRISSLGHAHILAKEYHNFSAAKLPETLYQDVLVHPYTFGNPQVLNMMGKLEHSHEDLLGAYIHGSLATNENILYSDFDALVIIRDAVFDSPARLASLARRLASLRRIMFQFDPLQHHGWFVLTEADLKRYCEAYFPVALFEHSRSLFPDHGLNLKVFVRDSSYESKLFFLELCDSMINRIKNGFRPNNMFQAKSFLSQFMLLPALYLQVINNEGIYKKYSFDIAKKDFPKDDWESMINASRIREIWDYDIQKLARFLLTYPIGTRRFATKYCAPRIPPELVRLMNEQFYASMSTLINSMRHSILNS